MKSPPLQTHHHHHNGYQNKQLLQEHLASSSSSQTPPNSPLPSSSATSLGASSSSSSNAAAAALLLFNKHSTQLNNYNGFFEYFDKLNMAGSNGNGAAAAAALNNGIGGRLNGKKRELTPNQSTDEMQQQQMQANNFSNPSYEEVSNGNGTSTSQPYFKVANSSGM